MSNRCWTNYNSRRAGAVCTRAPAAILRLGSHRIRCTQCEYRVSPGARNHLPRCGGASTCQSQHLVPDSWRCFLPRWPQSHAPISALLSVAGWVTRGAAFGLLLTQSGVWPGDLEISLLRAEGTPRSAERPPSGERRDRRARETVQRPSGNEKRSQGWTRSPESRRRSKGEITGD